MNQNTTHKRQRSNDNSPISIKNPRLDDLQVENLNDESNWTRLYCICGSKCMFNIHMVKPPIICGYCRRIYSEKK